MAAAATTAATADDRSDARFAGLALACVHQEYPNKIAHVLTSDADARPPRELTPAFYGCFDWHSSVHGHWLLARLARLHPDADYAPAARAALARSLTAANIAGEVAYYEGPGRASFERPYGLAWLFQLQRELRAWGATDPEAAQWAANLEPLVQRASARVVGWLPRLGGPMRTGEHSQTAFALGLTLDYALDAGDTALATTVRDRATAFFQNDRDCPLHYEPGGEDFVSPCLAEADLMHRILAPEAYAQWLAGFLPRIPDNGGADWLAPAITTDRTDGKLAHTDGLNLSRAWMLEGIAAGLPEGDSRRPALLAAARAHADAALPFVTGEHYEGGHWLGTFAVYLTTQAGIRQ